MAREQIARRCRELRDEAGLTQAEVAAKVGVDQSVISRIEAGERRVDSVMLQRLADVFGVSPAAFFAKGEDLGSPSVLLRGGRTLDESSRSGLAWLQQFRDEYLFLRSIEEVG